jgi:hypothetical protein
MARPKVSAESKRQRHVGIRLGESEYKKIIAESEKIGVTISAYIRSKAIRGFIQIPRYAKLDNGHIGQLSRLGGLLKKVHVESGGAYSQKTADMLEEIRLILTEMRRRLEDDREAHTEAEGQ